MLSDDAAASVIAQVEAKPWASAIMSKCARMRFGVSDESGLVLGNLVLGDGNGRLCTRGYA